MTAPGSDLDDELDNPTPPNRTQQRALGDPTEGEPTPTDAPPDPATLDPHSLVDMRIRHDPRFLGGDDGAVLLPTKDPNIMYVPAPEPPADEGE